jgi:hypothetical protein
MIVLINILLNFPKLRVAGSSPVSRSICYKGFRRLVNDYLKGIANGWQTNYLRLYFDFSVSLRADISLDLI